MAMGTGGRGGGGVIAPPQYFANQKKLELKKTIYIIV